MGAPEVSAFGPLICARGMERREALLLHSTPKAWAHPAGRARLSTLHRGVLAGATWHFPLAPDRACVRNTILVLRRHSELLAHGP